MPHANFTTIFSILSFEQLLGYEPSIFSRAKLAYIKLNNPTPASPRGAIPVNLE
jgi:hypothetical protein